MFIPLRVKTSSSETTSDSRQPTYLRLQACKKMELKILLLVLERKIENVRCNHVSVLRYRGKTLT